MQGIYTQPELQIFNNNLMQKVKVSNQDYFQVIRSKKFAANFSHIQYNHLSGSNYVCLDCDHDSFQIISETNLSPNLLVVNKDNNRGHLYFRLESFVGTTSAARTAPQRTLRLLTHSLNNYCGTDHAFNGVQAKNPLSGDFRAFSYSDKPYSFEELFDNIPEKHIYINQPHRIITENKEILKVAEGERNIYLFDAVRFEAYAAKHKHTSYQSFYKEVESVYLDLNAAISEPLGLNEAINSIKSIAKWTWEHYTGDSKNRGVLELDLRGHNLSLAERQTVGAIYSAKIKRNATLEAIQAAFEALQAEGIKPTQKAVAERSGKSERTVRSYWSQFKN